MAIAYEVTDGLGRLVIDRPERRNAMDVAMRREFAAHVQSAGDDDDDVRVLLICGAGESFCSGADLGQFKGQTLPSSRRMRQGGHHFINGLWSMDKPLVAAVRGPAVARQVALLQSSGLAGKVEGLLGAASPPALDPVGRGGARSA